MSANDENIEAAKNDNLQISNLSLRFLFLFLANVGIGNSMLFAVLPPLGRILKLPDWSISTIHSVSALLWVVTSPFWGRASDKFGRKPMILLGLIGYALSAIFLALAATIGIYANLRWEFIIISMIIARTVYGAFGSATNPAAQAYVADGSLPQNRTKAIAAITSAFAFGTAIGPAISSAMVSQFGILSPFWFSAILAIIAAYASQKLLPNLPKSNIEHPKKRHNLFKIATSKHVRVWLIFGIALSTVTAIVFQQLGFYFMDRLNIDPKTSASMVAITLSAGAMAQIITQIGLIPLLKFTPRQLVLWGTAITGFGTILTAAGSDFGVLTLAQILIGTGFGLARPGFTAGASLSVGHENQGAIAGLVVAANGFGFVIAPFFGAMIYAIISPQAPFFLASFILVFLAIYGTVSKSLEPREKEPIIEESQIENNP